MLKIQFLFLVLMCSFCKGLRFTRPDASKVQLVQETCSPEQFKDAMTNLIENELLTDGYASASNLHYHDVANRQCPTQKFVSEKKMIFNVGPGTTGTRFISDIMSQIGFKTSHDPHFTLEHWHEYDFIADSPPGKVMYQLLQAYPNAVFMMSMRDPKAWQKSRCNNHKCKRYHIAEPCSKGENDVSVDDHATLPRLASFYAWVKCIVPAERLYAFNLFETGSRLGRKESDRQFFEGLESFLQKHELMDEKIAKRLKDKVPSFYKMLMDKDKIDAMDNNF